MVRETAHGIIRNMERFFSIAGPCVAAKHYMDRLGLHEGWLVVVDDRIFSEFFPEA